MIVRPRWAKASANLIWSFLVVAAAVALPNAVLAQDDIQFMSDDPMEINAEADAYVIRLINATSSSDPVVFRVDQLTDALVDHAQNSTSNEQEQINLVMNGLTVTNIWDSVLADPYGYSTGQVDLSLFVAALLGLLPGSYGYDPYPGFLESRQQALAIQQTNQEDGTEDGRNFTADILQAYWNVVDLYTSSSLSSSSHGTDSINTTYVLPFDAAPWYFVSYGYANATNAQTVGFLLDRCAIFLNLGATNMLQQEFFLSAVIHETWHCFQTPLPSNDYDIEPIITLWELVLREGVVMYLTSMVDPTLPDHVLLLWPETDLQAAQEYQVEIVEAFALDRNSTDPSVTGKWYYSNVNLPDIPGAPTRSGYFVSFLAIQAYVEELLEQQNDESSFGMLAEHLLRITDTPQGRNAIWEAFVKKWTTASTNTTTSTDVERQGIEAEETAGKPDDGMGDSLPKSAGSTIHFFWAEYWTVPFLWLPFVALLSY